MGWMGKHGVEQVGSSVILDQNEENSKSVILLGQK